MSDWLKGLRPVHPGEVLGEDVIPGTRLSKKAFALRLGMSREALHNILSGRSAVTPVVALKLSRLLGTSPRFWLNMQQAYDLATVQKKRAAEIEQVQMLEIRA